MGLISHFLFHAGQLLFQVQNFILVELCQVVQLLLQALTPRTTPTPKLLTHTYENSTLQNYIGYTEYRDSNTTGNLNISWKA